MSNKEIPKTENVKPVSIKDTLITECGAMIRYALSNGIKVPAEVVKTYENYVNPSPKPYSSEPDISGLVSIHERLSLIVEPAKPGALLLIQEDTNEKSWLRFLGPVKLVRRMMVVGFASLILLIIISMHPCVNAVASNWDPNQQQISFETLIRSIFLLAAASLGVTFVILFRLRQFLGKGTFDPRYEPYHWIRYFLGIMSGYLLANMIHIEKTLQSDFGKPLLALLGGASSDVVYNIINRLVEAVKSLVSSSIQTTVDSQLHIMKAKLTEVETQNRFHLASEIMKMQQKIDSSTEPEQIKQQLGQIINKLLNNLTASPNDSPETEHEQTPEQEPSDKPS